jgi:hypothetical protein
MGALWLYEEECTVVLYELTNLTIQTCWSISTNELGLSPSNGWPN